ncbi:hypothetical protein CYA_1759 [Synechococcus sp. JA-3-3Ab]|nr:hypothetical protein CYA_1759 [Synechococcus sp. JA-3-3Ab]
MASSRKEPENGIQPFHLAKLRHTEEAGVTPTEGQGSSMLEPILIGLSAVLWGLLWGYATLLVLLVNFKEQGSVYAYPMQAVLDRFVESLGLGWLKDLHAMQLQPLRRISYALFAAVTLGVVLMLWVLG